MNQVGQEFEGAGGGVVIDEGALRVIQQGRHGKAAEHQAGGRRPLILVQRGDNMQRESARIDLGSDRTEHESRS